MGPLRIGPDAVASGDLTTGTQHGSFPIAELHGFATLPALHEPTTY